MLQMRARGFALRDAFADVLKGLKTVEEVQDYQEKPQHYTGGPTIDAAPAATAAPALVEVPAMEDRDPLRDRVDTLVARLAACATEMKFVAYEANSRKLLADIDDAERADLKAIAIAALASARARFVKPAATTAAAEPREPIEADYDDAGAEFDRAAAVA
jgi:hypothetical protein